MKRTLAVVGMVMWLAVHSLALAAEPAPAPAAEPAASPAAELLNYAPPGTWAALAVDWAGLRSAQLGGALDMATLGVRAPWVGPRSIDKVQALTVFVLPAQAPLDESGPPMCGVLRLAPGARQQVEERLTAGLTKTTVAGRDAYGPRDGGARLVFADDRTVVWGDSAQSVDAILKAYESPVGPSARLAELLKPAEGDAACGAAAFPQDLKAMLSPQRVAEVPPFWLGTRGGALNVGAQKGMRVNLRLSMANPADAMNAAGMATAFIQSRKQSMMYADPFLRLVLDKISIYAVGPELHIDFSLGEDELEQLRQDFGSALGRAREGAKKAAPQMNLHLIGLGIELYRLDHNYAYPPDLGFLVAEGHLQRKDELLDPSDTVPVRIGENGPLCSFQYIGPIPRGAPPGTIIAYTRKGIYPDGRNVLYEDLAVMWVSEADLHDPKGKPRTSLRASYQALTDSCGPDMTDEQKARLRKFYEVE